MTDLEELASALDDLDRIMARESFLAFYQRMTRFSPPAHMRVIAKLLQSMEADKVDRAMVFAPPRHIKRIADSVPVLTANRGWVAHGDLLAGDRLYHPGGGTVRVMAVHAPAMSDREVSFSHGAPIRCDAGHLWTVSDGRHRRNESRGIPKEWITLSTEAMEASGLHMGQVQNRRGSRLRWRLPEFFGTDGSESQTEMGAYTLGVWLGDGSTGKPRITMSAEDMAHVLPGITAEGYAPGRLYVHATTGVPTQDFARPRSRGLFGKCAMAQHLEAEGVLHDKRIPVRWISAGRAQRKALLAGLIDSDGHCEPATGRYRIVCSKPDLARDIHEICATLGYRPYTSHQDPGSSKPNRFNITTRQRAYTIGFQPHEPLPCLIPRKRTTICATRPQAAITAIRRVEPESARCVTTDAPDGLYLVGRDMIPTHNTLSCSKLFPAWIMGRHPTTPIMSVVHTQAFAGKVGRAVRNMLRHPAWPFQDVSLSDDSQAREYWTTPQGGEYNGFGATAGNQHGSPAEWLFMDDLMKGREMAMSPGQRDTIWENYETDMLSRLQGRRKQLMVFTRWHQDDPAGRILPENFDGRTGWYRDRTTGEPWFVLCLPAVCEHDNDPLGRKPGEWLWPEAFGEKQLGGTRKRGGYFWSALYQQRPSPVEGLMFNAEHLQRYDPLSLDMPGLQIYISSDYATKAEAGATDPDYTVHLVWGVDQDFNLYLLDGWRGRTESDVWVREWIRLCKKWKPLLAWEEDGQIIKSVGPFLTLMMREEKVYVARQQMVSSTSKEQRAQALLGMAAMGKLYLPMLQRLGKTQADFMLLCEAFEKEILQFPGGKHDDTVDAATLMARAIDKIVAGAKPKQTRMPHGDTLDDLHKRYEEANEARKRRRP